MIAVKRPEGRSTLTSSKAVTAVEPGAVDLAGVDGAGGHPGGRTRRGDEGGVGHDAIFRNADVAVVGRGT